MPTLHINDKASFQKKLAALQEASHARLHVIADFDQTLTKAFVDGKKVHSSYSLLREGDYLPPDFARRSYREFDHYYPYEHDTSLPLLLRQQKMEEWWTNHWNLLIACDLTKAIIQDIAQKSLVQLREGAEEFFKYLQRYQIPLLIFSSGLGDLIQMTLHRASYITPNVHLIANFFEWDDQGKAIGYKKPLIHSLNKNETDIQQTPYGSEVKKRRNILLLGNHPHDLRMSEGLPHDTILKIGFLNGDRERLPEYEQAFDIVFLEDGSLQPVVEILKKITGVPR